MMPQNDLENLENLLSEELKGFVKRGNINPNEIESVHKAIDSICKLQEMKSGGGDYSRRPYVHNYSSGQWEGDMRLNGTYNRSYPGSYSGSYSNMPRVDYGHSFTDRMVAKLEEMYPEAGNQHETELLQRLIQRVRSEV